MMIYMYKNDEIAEYAVNNHKRIYMVASKALQVVAFGLSYFGIFTYRFDLLPKPLLQSSILFRQLLELLIKVTWKK